MTETPRCPATLNASRCTAFAGHGGNHRALAPMPFGGCVPLVWEENVRDDAGLHQNAEMMCVVCTHSWVAVFPIENATVKCPACQHPTPVFR